MKMSIRAIEYYLPPSRETGASLLEDNPDWTMSEIEEKTGIKNRYLAGPGQTATDMAEIAAGRLLETTVQTADIDFLILVTQSPDYPLPGSAGILHNRLNLDTRCMSFDVNLGCSGYIYGLAIAGGLISTGLAKQGLLICSETYSKYVDRHDRSCRPLFSDGAAATLLSQTERDLVGPFELGADGAGVNNLIVAGGGARNPNGQKTLHMKGADVFMFTMDKVPSCVRALLEKSGKRTDDIDLFIFHQASKLVIDNIVRHLDLPRHKVFTNYEDIGNTVSPTIPIALKDAQDQGRLKSGDQVMLIGFGVGYSWGACIVQWEECR